MSSGRRNEARHRRSSSTDLLQPQSTVEIPRGGLNGWFGGRSTAGTPTRETLESPKGPRHGLQEPRLPSMRLHVPYLYSPALERGSLASPRSPRYQFAPTSPRSTAGTPTRESLESPGAPRRGLQQELHLPSTRLHLPYLYSPLSERGSLTSPRSPRYPCAPTSPRPPAPSSLRQHTQRASGEGETVFTPTHQPHGRRFVGVDPAELHLADLAAAGRRRRRQKTARSERLCGPKVKNPMIRAKLINCLLSGIFLTLVLSIYLAMALSHRQNAEEFHVVLIMMILMTTVFFCHSLVRLCRLINKPPPETRDLESQPAPAMIGPGGYANPAVPIPISIPVTLTRDDEATGIESDATKMPPPAYGLWRETVRVDPNRIFWQRSEDVPPMPQRSASSALPSPPNRPPSYVSEDEIEYLVSAAPRSVAPMYDVPLPPHPSERGRISSLPHV